MSIIKVAGLTKTFGDTRAVDDISFEVVEGEIVVIVGASGCGKTTTLRCIAGLERPTSGTIEISDRVVASPQVFVPPEARDVGMVFQSYALWPHKTVFENIAYGLRIKKQSRAEISRRVARAIELVGLQGLEDRYPSTLSGGQQQRVALARSAAAEPMVLLLDEPLSNLDAKLREQMRIEIKRLIRQLKCTAVHITHDQVEAMAIADRIIFMRHGRIEQIGLPRELYRRPAKHSVAAFIGAGTFLKAKTVRKDPVGSVLQAEQGLELLVSDEAEIGADVTAVLRPENIVISQARPNGANVFEGVVEDASFLGNSTEYRINLGGLSLKASSDLDLPLSTTVFAQIDPNRIILIKGAAETTESDEDETSMDAVGESES